ncbi:MAG: glycosyltransferase [Myxococcales bacterium]|nr:glycosyltransferase [Myxococcales bacterium]
MERVRSRGMFFFEGESKFWLRGVSYGPFRPRAGGEPLPDEAQLERDFALLRTLGANTVRLYHVPPPSLVERAERAGLRLLVGVPWAQHVRFLDGEASRREIRTAVRRAALATRDAPSVLGLVIGNEIPPQIVRWYGSARIGRFLSELADEVRQHAPETLVSYASFPMTEYLELDFSDFVSFNVYLHREEELRGYLARLQNLADFRPLVLTEHGVDSLREGAPRQAEIVSRTASTAAELGLAGSVVFSFTDEWYTGDQEVLDWAFGLVDRDRAPKPAFAALRQVYEAPAPPLPEGAPRASVVVCAYNAERTLRECLESLDALRYADFDVIVVDDGSTDGTRAIAEAFPRFRLLSQENRGLSAARNEGIEAATGEIVAFTDADCAVDPDWLTFLVQRLVTEDIAGVGGPNLPPREERFVPEVVALCPGGPVHVLLTDHEAEHVPGCNMAFWKEAIQEIGGFDPAFRAAGDDVDVCWRLQNAGERIGFAPAALVWHKRRDSIAAYLAQQRGYGRAESLLYLKHPYRFNFMGHSRWLGRIYEPEAALSLGQRPVIYAGPFGSALFQTLYEPPSSLLRHLPGTLEWHAVAVVLFVLGALTAFLGTPVREFALAGAGLLLVSWGWAAGRALGVDVRRVPGAVWRARLSVGVLSYLGPLLRAVERYRSRVAGLSRPERVATEQPRQSPVTDPRQRAFGLSYWNESGIEKEACIAALVAFLRPRKVFVMLDDGWQPWDLLVRWSVWARAEISLLVQNHGGPRRQVDVRVRLRATRLARLTTGLLVAGAGLAALSGAWGLALVLTVLLAGTGAIVVQQGLRLGRTLYHATETATRSLPLEPAGPAAASR